MIAKKNSKVFWFICFCFFGYAITYAQSSNTPNRGIQIGNSYSISDIETINSTNGNLMLNIPIASLPSGRGGNPGFTLRLSYNSKLYDSVPNMYSAQVHSQHAIDESYTYNNLIASQDGGWHFGLKYNLDLEYRKVDGNFNRCDTTLNGAWEDQYIYKLSIRFPDGSKHEFRPLGFHQREELQDGYYNITPDGWVNNCEPNGYQAVTSGMTYYSADGTYIRLFVEPDSDRDPANNSWTLYFPDGTKVTNTQDLQRVFDRNNNFVEIQQVTLNDQPATQISDQLNRKITIQDDPNTSNTNITTIGVGGEPITITVKWKYQWVFKNYDTGLTSSPGDYVAPAPRTLSIRSAYGVIDQIIFPGSDGPRIYTFGYNGSASTPSGPTYGFGEVSSITMPSGAQVRYKYVYDGIDNLPWDEVLANSICQKDITYNQEYNGNIATKTDTWQYDIPGPAGSSRSRDYSLIYNPDGGVNKDSFYTPKWGWEGWLTGIVYKSEGPDGSVVERQWVSNNPIDVIGKRIYANPYVKTEYTSIRDNTGQLSKTAIKDYEYDKNGNVTKIVEYDWVDYSSIQRSSNYPYLPEKIPSGISPKKITINEYYNQAPKAQDAASNNGNIYSSPSSPRLRNVVKASEIYSDFSSDSLLSRIENTYDNASTTGNLTEQKVWDSTKGTLSRPLSTSNAITVTHQYDVFGNLTLINDARGIQTQYIYDPINEYADLYPTQIKKAVGTSIQSLLKYEYDFNRGLVVRSTDMDNNISTKTSYDRLGRPILVQSAEATSLETKTSTEYFDSERRVVARSDLNSVGDGKLISIQHFDQLDRIRLSRKLENGNYADASNENAGIIVQTQYDSMGRVLKASSPYRNNESINFTETTYDLGGRVLSVKTPDGALVTTTYNANEVLVTDQSGKTRKSETDAIGRLIKITENPGRLNYETTYSYDALGNLRQTNQGVQTRTFVYDSLSRLVSTTNPESGTITYSYDPNGNLLEKTDARQVKTSMSYDALNRVTLKTYSGETQAAADVANITPSVHFYYDDYTGLPSGAPSWSGTPSKGKLIGVTYGSGSEGTYYKYDALGRIITNHQRQGTSNYPTTYKYDISGNITQESRGNRRKSYFYYDDVGRFTRLQTSSYPYLSVSTIVSDVQYTSFGALQKEAYGNGLSHILDYNVRQQPGRIWLGKPETPGNRMRLDYIYGTVEDINKEDPYILSQNNNGNIGRIKYFLDGVLHHSQSFQYDDLNRLKYAVEHNSGNYSDGTRAWYQTFDYDRYGNRGVNTLNTSDNADANNSALLIADFSETKNQIIRSDFIYDTAGNLISEPGKTYTYDAENRIVTATVGGILSRYTYDGNGRRVKKVINGTGTRFEYGVGGELLAERNDSGVVTKDYLYRNGEMIALSEDGTAYKFATSDHLGSPRVWTDWNGNVIANGRHDYVPFGEELFAGTGTRTTAQGYGGGTQQDGQRKQFTSKERDVETGLDYFLARYYSSTQGRFISPDEFTGGPDELFYFAADASANPTFYADLTNPQSLNKYQYTYNNPLRYIDADGHSPCCLDEIKQLAKDTGIGTAKGVANVGIDTANLVNSGTDALISPFTDFRFGQIKRFGGSTPGEKNAMKAVTVVAIVAPVGQLAASAKVGSILSGTKSATSVGEAAAATSKAGSKVGGIVQDIKNSNIGVKVNPRNATTAQEGNVTLSSGNTRVNLRVETHPLVRGGPPVRHANVEVLKKVNNKTQEISNKHITN